MPEQQTQCPRCQQLFACKSDSIQLCECRTVHLDPAQLEFIRLQYSECLCVKCIRELKEEQSAL